jgi:uncharacterized protein (TIGR02300 family)
MSTNKAERGTKRTCQNPECGQRFYDLNHSPIVCPVCESAYKPEAVPVLAAGSGNSERAAARRAPKKPVYAPVEVKPEEAPEGEEALAGIEGDEEEPAAAEEDETFLEAEEEDGSDMTNIIGGPVAETDEQQ